MIAAGEISELGVAGGVVARRPLRSEGRSLGAHRGPELPRGPPPYPARPRGPDLRRPAHRVGAGADPGDRRDPPAQRRAGPRQRDRRRPSPASSTSTRSSNLSASASAAIFATDSTCSSRSTTRRRRDPLPVRRRGRPAASTASRPDRSVGTGLTSSRDRAQRRPSLPRYPRDDAMPVEAVVRGRGPESWLGVPIPAGERVIGVVGLESAAAARVQRRRRAAPVHARLEHGRRPRERPAVRRDEASPRRDGPACRRAGGHQRDGQALAAELEMQAMYELVGERIREIFEAQARSIIALLRPRPGPDPVPVLDRAMATRLRIEPARLGDGLDLDRDPIQASASRFDQRSRTRSPQGRSCAEGAEPTDSWLGVPILGRADVTGVIVARRTCDRKRLRRGATSACCRRSPRASASPSRTPACSTRRSGSWPRPTSGRPSWPSSTRSRQGSPSSSTSRRCRTRRRARSASIFDAQVDRHRACYDPRPGLLRFAVRPIEAGERVPHRAVADRRGPRARRHPRRASRSGSIRDRRGVGSARAELVGGRADRVVARRPDHGRRPVDRRASASRARSGMRSTTPTNDSSRRSPRAWASRSRTPGCSTRRRRLLAETDERAAELAIINSVQQGLAARARHAGDVRARRRQDPARSSTPRSSTSAIFDLEAGLVHFPYTIERGVRFPDEPIADRRLPREHVIETRQPLADQRRRRGAARRAMASPVVDPGRAAAVRPVRAARSSATRSRGVDLAPEPRPRDAFSDPTCAS